MGRGGDDTQESYARLVLLHHGHEWAVDPRHLRGDLQRGVVRGATGGAFGFDNQSLIAALQSGAQTAGSPSAPPASSTTNSVGSWCSAISRAASMASLSSPTVSYSTTKSRARGSRLAHDAPAARAFSAFGAVCIGADEGCWPVVRPVHEAAGAVQVSGDDLGDSRIVFADQAPRGPAPGLCPQRLVRLLHASSLASRRPRSRPLPLVWPQRPCFVRTTSPKCQIRARRVKV